MTSCRRQAIFREFVDSINLVDGPQASQVFAGLHSHPGYPSYQLDNLGDGYGITSNNGNAALLQRQEV